MKKESRVKRSSQVTSSTVKNAGISEDICAESFDLSKDLSV
jgi:hypothetical protein